MWPSAALALDPSRDVAQYGRTVWRNLDGFGPGTVWVITQTTDGYLWLGTPSGLMRFDGVSNVKWNPPAGSALPDDRIRALLGASDGTLWIGTMRGLATWKDGKLTRREAFDGKLINALVEEDDGTVWVGGSDQGAGLLCELRAGQSECHGQDGRFGPMVMALQRDAAGALWISGREQVWKWKPGPAVSYPLPSLVGGVRSMAATPDGGIVVATRTGMVKILDGHVQPLRHASMPAKQRFNKVLCDRDGALWMAVSEGGLLHLHGDRLDSFTSAGEPFGNQIYALFEDREGNVWVATREGLNRFRPMAARIYARAQRLEGSVSAVLAASDGSVWASSSLGLYRIHRGDVTRIRSQGAAVLFEDRRGRMWAGSVAELGYFAGGRFVNVQSAASGYDAIVEDSQGQVWIAKRDEGLLRLAPDGKIERTPWADLGSAGFASSLAADPVEGGIWIGFWSGDLLHWRDGSVRASVRPHDGPQERGVNHVRVDANGTLWVATEAGLIRIKGGQVSRLDTRGGLPCDSVYHSLADKESVWMYTGCGLVQVAHAELDSWAASLKRGTPRRVTARLLDYWDGIRTDLYRSRIGQFADVRHYTPRMARGRDGLIWLATLNGVVAIDPARLPFNGIPPPVNIEHVVGDGTPYDPEPRLRLRLPPLVRNLEIHYTGLSLTIPDKVRFRYKLEGRDAEWHDAGNRRRAFYTDLPPGEYRFRVIAANNSGLWNERGDSLEFTIEAAWWQTNAFRAACAAALALLLYVVYRGRVARLKRRLGVTLEARVNERMRISRDLHDTLLQSFHGLLLRFQTVLQLWPRDEARQLLEKTIDQAADAITEGRDAVQGLRASANETEDLAEAIRALGETLTTQHGERPPVLRVEVQGTARALHPILRDEIFRIAAEALRNALHHAAAKHVEVEIRYDERQLRLRVRDDGRGMEPKVLEQGGREGHFGLRGMRERAQVIGGKLTVWSAEGTGTEMELTVPASHAYAAKVFPSFT